MAKKILKDAFIEVDGTDLSEYFSEVSIESERDEHEVTGFGAEMKEIALGLGDGTITGSLFQDFDADAVDATLWPLHQGDDPFPIVVRSASDAVSETNPQWTMQAVMPSYSPLSGAVGEPSTTEVSFRNATQAGIVRSTT